MASRYDENQPVRSSFPVEGSRAAVNADCNSAGIYIREAALDALNGLERLSSSVPRTLDEVERFMKRETTPTSETKR